MSEIFNMEDAYKGIDEALKEAEKDDTPFLVVDDDNLTVVGDANKTEVKQNDYVLSFRFPKGTKIPKSKGFSEGLETKYGVVTQKEYKDFFIAPRKNMNIVRLLINILPFFKKQNDDGTVTEYTEDEIASIIGSLTDEIINAMYDLVCYVFDVDTALRDYIEPMCVARLIIQLIKDYPEVSNEADTFFDSSVQNQ